MSGLFGFFDPEGELPQETAEQMASVLACPADQSVTILRHPACSIGCVSKKIYPAEGEVLASNRSSRRCLFMGRLLGCTTEVSCSDPIETARQVFLENATPERLAAANGPFAAAVWDENRAQLELITDRYGMYPLYLGRYRSAVLFAGQIKALLAARVLSTEFDPVAVALMLSIGELVGDQTLIRAVRLLDAGTRAVFSTSGEQWKQYWRYTFSEEETDFDGTARRLGGLLRTSVARICADSESIGVPLSGGLDSRVLLAAAPDSASVPSFTWGIPGCRDLRYADAVARAVGSPHHALEYDGGYLERFAALGVWITEGQLPCVDFHVLPYVEAVAKRCRIILNGYAGDAILGGNFVKRTWWKAGERSQAGKSLWQWRCNSIPSGCRAALGGPALHGCNFLDARKAFIDCYLDTQGTFPMGAAMAFLLDNRVRRRTSCGTSLMRWRVESDQPFFDNDFFDAASRVPMSWRHRHRLYLQMLRTCYRKTARIPWQRTGLAAKAPNWQMYLALGLHRLGRFRPFHSFFRDKQVSDFDGWMRGKLRHFVSKLLLNERTLDRGVCNPDTIRSVVRDHMDCVSDNSALLGSIMALELFARLFVDCDEDLVGSVMVDSPPIRIVSLEPVS